MAQLSFSVVINNTSGIALQHDMEDVTGGHWTTAPKTIPAGTQATIAGGGDGDTLVASAVYRVSKDELITVEIYLNPSYAGPMWMTNQGPTSITADPGGSDQVQAEVKDFQDDSNPTTATVVIS